MLEGFASCFEGRRQEAGGKKACTVSSLTFFSGGLFPLRYTSIFYTPDTANFIAKFA
ncbi:MAG: hypothetical protein F6K14_18995 [Symploca sp. SIO2C1]|nr:hypothetical protein [Symploca sp. SIO2C1]